MIHAIDTVYRGYKFRSRLEARWAVFFDEIDLEWMYEPEGVKLSDGSYYLPDFYFPELKKYGEVKPYLDNSNVKDPRWLTFIHDLKTTLLILRGVPGEYDVVSMKFWEDAMCKHCRQLVAAIECGLEDGDDDRCGENCCKELDYERGTFELIHHFDNMGMDIPKIERAYSIAKQARFEHDNRNY